MQQTSSESTLHQHDSASTAYLDRQAGDSASTVHANFLDRPYRSHHRRDPEAANVAANSEKHRVTSKGGQSARDNPIYVKFEDDDPRNPMNFSGRRKWIIILAGCFILALNSAAGSTYNQGFSTMATELHTTQYIANFGLALFNLGAGIAAVMTASLSEEFGRVPLYIVSASGMALTHLMIALAPNITTVIIGRFLNGGFGSIGSTIVSGSVADMWSGEEQGFLMAMLQFVSLASIGIGGTVAAYIEVAPGLGWRWIQWIHLIVTGIYTLLLPILMKETRPDVILICMARKRRKETGDPRNRAKAEDDRPSFKTSLYESWTRPIYLLFTEPVVASWSLWIGLASGVLNGIIASLGSILRDLYHFNTTSTGLMFLTYTIGASLGLATTLIQERLYRMRVAHRGPEARLYTSCGAAILFPAGMFVFAWCGLPSVPWPALASGMVLFMWAICIMYTAGSSYMSDVYGPYASSAIAGQTFVRNMAGTAFPLFISQMNEGLGYPWSNTIFAIVASLMAPVPYVLFFYGPKLQAQSKFASEVRR